MPHHSFQANGEAQYRFVSDQASRHCLYVSGWGGGKTYAGAYKHCLLRILNRAPGLMVGQDYGHLWTVMADAVEQHAHDLGMMPRRIVHHRVIVFQTVPPAIPNPWRAAFTHCRSAHKPEAIRAVNASDGWYDEPAAYRSSIREAMRSPLLQLRGRVRGNWPCLQHNYTGTQEGKQTELYKLFYETATTGDHDTKAIYRGSTADNVENVGQAFIDDNVAGLPPEVQGQYLHGGVGELLRALAAWNWTTANVAPVSYTPGYPLLTTWDFNLAPLCVTVAQKIGQLDDIAAPLHVLGECIMRHKGNTAELAARLAEEWRPIHAGAVYVYGDATGKSGSTQSKHDNYAQICEVLGRAWTADQVYRMVPQSNPSITQRLVRMNAVVGTETSGRRLLVHPSARNLIRDMEGCELKDGKEDQRNGYSHSLAGLGYLTDRLYPLAKRSWVPQGESDREPDYLDPHQTSAPAPSFGAALRGEEPAYGRR
ncbi:MAG TPA: hypothetical protein DCQ64_15970 [Candidatus Rokubacteria bacterium]|nr:hypothetical protein [Candidatus Rokubacteria bacterium]